MRQTHCDTVLEITLLESRHRLPLVEAVRIANLPLERPRKVEVDNGAVAPAVNAYPITAMAKVGGGKVDHASFELELIVQQPRHAADVFDCVQLLLQCVAFATVSPRRVELEDLALRIVVLVAIAVANPLEQRRQ